MDTTEWLHFHFSVSCIGEGNGNPLQCSCLENPRDWGALWAAVYGVTQSQTRLKWLGISSSINKLIGREIPFWIFSRFKIPGQWMSLTCPFFFFFFLAITSSKSSVICSLLASKDYWRQITTKNTRRVELLKIKGKN